MNLVVLAVGIVLLTTGFITFVLPGRLRQVLEWFTVGNRFGLAVMGRLAVGLALLLGAQGTRWPAAAITLGLVFLAGGAAIPVLGEERVARIANWWLVRPDVALRAWSVLVIALGAGITWLAVPGTAP